jgi:hypothetical protein
VDAREVDEARRQAIPHEVAEQLGYYVYLLRDPRSREVFYVGKGVGNRVYAHAADARKSADSERAKLRRINEIVEAGAEVEHLFVRTGLPDEDAAYVVEQAVIDSMTAAGVVTTNIAGGHHSELYGLSTVQAAVARLAAPTAPPITEPTVIFVINRAWRRDMNDEAVYAITRGNWRIGANARSKARYAFGVAFGVVRGVYRISGWEPATKPGDEGRWTFSGERADEMIAFEGASVRHLVPERGIQNPVRLYL